MGRIQANIRVSWRPLRTPFRFEPCTAIAADHSERNSDAIVSAAGVEDGDEERERADPPLAGGGQVPGQGGGGDAAGAGADEVDVGAAG